MQIKKKRLSATIAIVLTLTFIASMITSLPIAFGQMTVSMSATSYVVPDPVGVNQTVLIEGSVYPAPEYAINLTFTITKPDGNVTTIEKVGSKHAHAYFDYVPDQTGTWRVRVSWNGDALHRSASSTRTWTVQNEPVPAQQKIATYAYITTGYNAKTTAGLGQSVVLLGWITPPHEISGGIYDPDYDFIVTKPSGATTTYTKSPDSTAAITQVIVVDEIGTWSAKLSWAGDKLHLGDTSDVHTWTVQQDPVPTLPQQPIPDYIWDWPISAEFNEWYQIAGSWPMVNYDAARTNHNPYTKGPNTPHILWKQFVERAGIVGETGYENAMQSDPESRAYDIIAAYGRLYYRYTDGYDDTQHPVVVCVDQFTGEQLWERHLKPDGAGGGGNLVFEVSTKPKLDPKVGIRAEAKSSIWVIGGGGIWEIDPLNGYTLYYLPGRTGTYNDHAIFMNNYNWTRGASQSGVMTRWSTLFKAPEWVMPVSGATFIGDDIIFQGSQGTGSIPYGQRINTWNATTGEPLAVNKIIDIYSTESAGRTTMKYGKWFFHSSTTLSVHAVDLVTGNLAWSSEPNEKPWGQFGSYVASIGYGNYYQGTWDGYVSCYDAATGATKWRTFLGDNPDVPMGHNVPWGVPTVADGKIYIVTSEHTPPNPYPRGNKMYCLNAYNGEKIWEFPFMNGYSSGTVPGQGISSGILFAFNMYDGCIYNFGRGESKTTVQAPLTAVPAGTGILIQGTVLDQSAGCKDTPCVSDADQEAWMQHLYYNKPDPNNTTGVHVTLAAIASDGSVTDIGGVMTDSSGQYRLLWTPSTEGIYTIVANFDGTEAYYDSYGTTSVAVAAAPEAGAEEPVADNTILLTGIIAAIVVVAILVSVSIILQFRKK